MNSFDNNNGFGKWQYQQTNKIDKDSLVIVRDLLNLVINRRYQTSDDIQKDLVLAQRGLNMMVDQYIKNRMETLRS